MYLCKSSTSKGYQGILLDRYTLKKSYFLEITIKQHNFYRENGGIKMNLKERTKAFLKDTGATVTAFCRKNDISPSWYYRWINEEHDLSENIKQRITTYLDSIYKK